MSGLPDAKAVAARAQAVAARSPKPVKVGEPFPGVVAWKVGGEGGVLVVMPRLRPGAPASVRRRLKDRIIANATGRCPRCGEAVGVTGLGAAEIHHRAGCSVLWRDRDDKWLDPAGVAALLDREAS